jgi:cytochrome P450 StaP
MKNKLKKFDPFDEDYQKDPYKYYPKYQEFDPVHWGESASPWRDGSWYIFSYNDIETLMMEKNKLGKDVKTNLPEFYKSPENEFSARLTELFSSLPLFQDPPEHTRSRKLIIKYFNNNLIRESIPKIEQIVETLLNSVNHDRFDLVKNITSTLPLLVIARLIGIPEKDVKYLKSLTLKIIDALDAKTSKEVYYIAGNAAFELQKYFKLLFEVKKISPENDIFSKFIQSQAEDNISDDEIISFVIFLLFTGYPTTTIFLSKSILHLISNPNQLSKLLNNPNLMDSAIEELLRYRGVMLTTTRYALEDIHINGKVIKKGDHIALMNASGNHDPKIYKNPMIFDITRKPNKHLTFGVGQRFCMGANLARMEAKVLFDSIFRKFPKLEIIEPPENIKQIASDAPGKLILKAIEIK